MKFTTILTKNDAINLLKFYRSTKKNSSAERLFMKIVENKIFVELIKEKISDSKSEKAKKGVKEILSLASGIRASKIKNSDRLRIDLKISPNIHSRLYRPFNRLIKILGSTKIVRSSEVVDCNKVEDCIKLVIKNL